MMGAKLCTPFHPISNQKSKSVGARDGTSSSSLSKELIKLSCLKVESQRRLRGSMTEDVKRKQEMEAHEKKKKKKVTLEDMIKASPDLKPDSLNLNGGESSDSYKQSKKKVHPCLSQSQCPRSLLSETKDSLYLDRPLNHIQHGDEEIGEISDCSSIMRSLSGKSQKRVSFKLPHDVIFFSPDQPYCKEASSKETYGREDSFGSAIPYCRGNSSFDSTEEPVVRLAVYTLPYIFKN